MSIEDLTEGEKQDSGDLPVEETAAGNPASASPPSGAAEQTGVSGEDEPAKRPEESAKDESAAQAEAAKAEKGRLAGDVRMAWAHHLKGLKKAVTALEWVFHYFFLGCLSLLGLAVAFLIPLTVLACVAVVLGLPGYMLYRWFGTEGNYFSPWYIAVTIFWAGYLVTHGWPQLRDRLQALFQKARPGLEWGARLLTRMSEKAPQPPAQQSDEPAK